MSLEAVKQRIAVANAQCASLNNTRQVNIGKKETLTKQLEGYITEYKTKYGVDITMDNFQDEVNRVQTLKEQEVTKLETMIQYIKEGRYAEAEALATGKSVEQQPVAETTPVQDNFVQQTMQFIQEEVQPTPAVGLTTQIPMTNPEVQPVPSTYTGMPNMGVNPVPATPTSPAPFKNASDDIPMPKPPVPPTSPLGQAMVGFTPVGGTPMGMPSVAPTGMPKPPTDFKSILSGSDFN